jgi:hypothetical protein
MGPLIKTLNDIRGLDPRIHAAMRFQSPPLLLINLQHGLPGQALQ